MIQSHDLEFFQLINKKVNTVDMNDALSSKADMNVLTSMVKTVVKDVSNQIK